MLLSTCSSPLKLDLSLFSSFTEAGTPFLITIPLKRLLLSVNDHVPCSLSLYLYLEDSSVSRFLSVSPLLLLLPQQHVPKLLIGPYLIPLGCGLEGPGGKEQSYTSHPLP